MPKTAANMHTMHDAQETSWLWADHLGAGPNNAGMC